MTPLVPLSIFSLIPLIIVLFDKFPKQPRIAVIIGFLYAFMYLPYYGYGIPLFPEFNKINTACYGVLIATYMKHPEVFQRFKFSIVDVPVVVWCVVPLFTSISNGLGIYDGMVTFLGASMTWGAPYFLGRLYITSRQAVEDLLMGFFIGALLYVPLCLYEVAMSPQLHKQVYGFHPHDDFSQSKRGGGWRPQVFMNHGLMNGMWMASGTLAGVSLFLGGALKRRLPGALKAAAPFLVLGLMGNMVLLKSMGALMLMMAGIGMLVATKVVRMTLPLFILLLFPLWYVTVRSTGYWKGQDLLDFLGTIADPARIGSLSYRMYNETNLSEHAWTRPLLGWGGWDRSFIFDEEGNATSVPDGMWILAFGKTGYIGLYSLFLTFLLGPLLFLFKYPAKTWKDKQTFAIASAPIIVTLFAIDSLLNDMFNPIMPLLIGGLVAVAVDPSGEEEEELSELEELLLNPPMPRLL